MLKQLFLTVGVLLFKFSSLGKGKLAKADVES